jgi:hypothetical protein
VSGLLISGVVVPVPGVIVYNPLDTPWCKLDPGDYAVRKTTWIRQVIIHTTKGLWPQYVKAGSGPGGKDKAVADFWRGDPQHSAAQLVVDRDGSVACLCDLAKCAAYHATTSNDWSVGVEMYQDPDGGIFEATFASTVAIVTIICEHMGIPLQIPSRQYDGSIIRRMIQGGKDMAGVFGHRDQAWDFKKSTSSRGRGDPGDEIYRRLAVVGADRLDFENRRDVELWRARQVYLNSLGETLVADGLPGPGTMAALRRRGFVSGRQLDTAIRG